MKVGYQTVIEKMENPLTQSVGEILEQGLNLIEKMDDASFADGGRGSVGTHFRHCLDFASNFLSGLKSEKFDYSQRERNTGIETDRQLAIQKLSFIIQELQTIEMFSTDFISEAIASILSITCSVRSTVAPTGVVTFT